MTDFRLADCTDAKMFDSDILAPAKSVMFAEELSKLAKAIEALASVRVVHSGGTITEQGLHHVVYANGAVKPEGEAAPSIKCASFDREDQIAAVRKACEETFEVVKANKPDDAGILVWRREPGLSLALMIDGLYVHVNVRLSWVVETA